MEITRQPERKMPTREGAGNSGSAGRVAPAFGSALQPAGAVGRAHRRSRGPVGGQLGCRVGDSDLAE